jgi:hypothetical protein
MCLPPGSSGYRNPISNYWNGTNLRNSLQMGRDGGKGDGKALDPPPGKRQRKSQLTSEGTYGPQTRLRCRLAVQDSSSAPTRCTRGGSTSVPSCRTLSGSSSAPSCHTRGGSTAVPSCRTQGGSTPGRRHRGSSPALPFKVSCARSQEGETGTTSPSTGRAA